MGCNENVRKLHSIRDLGCSCVLDGDHSGGLCEEMWGVAGNEAR
jgi:hypothetical protein